MKLQAKNRKSNAKIVTVKSEARAVAPKTRVINKTKASTITKKVIKPSPTKNKPKTVAAKKTISKKPISNKVTKKTVPKKPVLRVVPKKPALRVVSKKLVEKTAPKKPAARATKSTKSVKPKASKGVKKGAKMQTVVEAKTKVSRKRLKTPLGSALRSRVQAGYDAFRAREVRKQLEARGLAPSSVTVHIKEQRLLALQVRDNRNSEWGTLRSIPFNEYTPEAQLRKHRRYLNNLKIGWIISNYFEGDVEYRVCEIIEKGYQTTY